MKTVSQPVSYIDIKFHFLNPNHLGKLLLEAKAEVESKDRNGKTPLWWATEKGTRASSCYCSPRPLHSLDHLPTRLLITQLPLIYTSIAS
jgi:ankyrin repeat protein